MNSLIKIIPPTNCPSCASLLELVKDQLFCRSTDCSTQAIKRVDAFAKVLRIKGLGIKTIQKLELTDMVSIYKISANEINDVIGLALGTKLHASIQESRRQNLATLIRSFSIPLVGKVASEKLASVVSSIQEINLSSCKKASLGEKTSEKLCTWLDEVWYQGQEDLLDYIDIIDTAKKTNKSLDVSIVITGKLDNYKNRREAASYLESRGYTVKSSVTKQVDFLISEEGRESSSSKKAKSLNIPILSINELLNKHNTKETKE